MTPQPTEPPDTGLYSSPAEASKKVSSEYEYWSGKLTETSLHLCYAVIGANWVVFGSINGILDNNWAKMSLLMVILALASNIVGAWVLSWLLRKRVIYSEDKKAEWIKEFNQFVGIRSTWPFTDSIDAVGLWMRRIKAVFTLAAGACLIWGAINTPASVHMKTP
jgi:hypothetical protein